MLICIIAILSSKCYQNVINSGYEILQENPTEMSNVLFCFNLTTNRGSSSKDMELPASLSACTTAIQSLFLSISSHPRDIK